MARRIDSRKRTRRSPRVMRPWFTILSLGALLLTPPGASAIATPPWTGPKDLEPKFRADWYACYRDAEKSVPPISVQGAGEQGAVAVVLALNSRNQSVADLTVACMHSLGYEVQAPPSSSPSPASGAKPKPKGK